MKRLSYTGIPSPEVEKLLDEALPRLAADIGSLPLPKLAGVVLGGGYGRGEGGVLRTAEGDKLYNDLDFFVFADGAGKDELAKIDHALPKLAEPWEKRLGVAVDFGPAKNLSALKNVAHTLMFQELRHGWRPVWGDVDLDALLPELPPEKLPFTEAVRLLLNRGMGLLLAGNELKRNGDADFIMRNIHKAVLGGGDALLIASGNYRWHGAERVKAFREYAIANGMPPEFAESYAASYDYKLEPVPRLPVSPWTSWRQCRRFYLEAAGRVAGCHAPAAPDALAAGLHRGARAERSVKNLLRWLRHRGGPRPLCAAFDAPVVTVAGMLCKLLAESEDCPACPERLDRLWHKFN